MEIMHYTLASYLRNNVIWFSSESIMHNYVPLECSITIVVVMYQHVLAAPMNWIFLTGVMSRFACTQVLHLIMYVSFGYRCCHRRHNVSSACRSICDIAFQSSSGPIRENIREIENVCADSSIPQCVRGFIKTRNESKSKLYQILNSLKGG